MTTLNQYQEAAKLTAVYPHQGSFVDSGTLGGLAYLGLGLTGEAGEVAEKIKKAIRDGVDDHGEFVRALRKELGDVLWYAAMIARELGLSFDDVAERNMRKLADRKQRGALHGSGDDR